MSFFQGGAKGFDGVDTGIDCLFDFPLYGGIRRAFGQGKPIPELAYVTAHDSLYQDPGCLVTFLGNHDVMRFLPEQGTTDEGLTLAFTYLLTTRGIPMIYYGDEIAMRGGEDPDNRKDFPGGWKDDPSNAFNDQGRTQEARDVFNYVHRLAQLRQSTPDLRTGRLTQLGAGKNGYVYRRGGLIVLINDGAQPLRIETDATPGTWKDLLDNAGNVPVHDRIMTVTLPPRSAAIMKQREPH